MNSEKLNKLLEGCGQQESLGRSACEENNLCSDCSLELKGYIEGKLEVLDDLRDAYKFGELPNLVQITKNEIEKLKAIAKQQGVEE